MENHNPYLAPRAISEPIDDMNSEKDVKINGRLIVVILFIVVNALIDGYKILFEVKSLLSGLYFKLAEPLYILLLSCVLAVLWIVAIILFIHRKALFKKWFLVTVIINLCVSIIAPAFQVYRHFPFLSAYESGMALSIIAQGVGYSIFIIPISIFCICYVFSKRQRFYFKN